MSLFRRTSTFFTSRERWVVGAIVLSLSLSAALEVLGIGLLVPFVQVVQDPATIRSYPMAWAWMDRLGVQGPGETITAVGLALIVVFAVKNAYLAFQWYLISGFIYRKSSALARRLFERYLSRDYLFHLHQNPADLIRTATSEVQMVVPGIVYPGMKFVGELLVTLGLAALLVSEAPWAALVAVALIGSIGWAIAILVRRRLGVLADEKSRHHAWMIDKVNQGLGGIKEIKVLGREDHFVDRFAESAQRLDEARRANSLIANYPRFIMEFILVLVIVVFVMVLVWWEGTTGGALSSLVLFAAVSIRLAPATNRMVSHVNQIRYNAPAVEHVYEGLEGGEVEDGPRPRQGGPGPDELTGDIRFEAVCFRYPESGMWALEGLTFEIERGSTVGIVGPSGAGKTTLLGLLLGLLEPTEGRIRVGDCDVRETLDAWRRQIGYIPQQIYLSDETIRRNVAFGVPDAEIDDRAVIKALELASLQDFVAELPDGIHSEVGERGVRVSGGQRQWLAIARALYHDPSVLILDEATASLDYETERAVAMALREISDRTRRTVIIVAHRLSTVRECDMLFLMDGGKLVASGAFAELRDGVPRFRTMLAGEEGTASVSPTS